MEHPSHEHSLILNEIYIAKESDVCRGCREQIVSCKSFVYSCSRITANTSATDDDNASCAVFLLHKTCAELPTRIPHPANPNQFLRLRFNCDGYELWITETRSFEKNCDICGIRIPCKPEQFFYCHDDIDVCLKCVLFETQKSSEDPVHNHPAHSHHPLSLIHHPSSFKCYACNVDDNIRDMSYKCTKCQFWMHKTCADAPTTFQFQFHPNHPLTLSFSLPKVCHKYPQHCRLCKETLSRFVWLYSCLKCRFFTHFQCARSNQMLSYLEDEKYDPDLLHLPAAEESSANLLGEQLIMSVVNNNNSSMCSSTESIKHWAHQEHCLQLINGNELNNQKDDDKLLLLCDGCVKPIRNDDDQFYGCVPCKFFLHKFCAELPKEIKHHLAFTGGYVTASKHRKPYKFFICGGCGIWCNGIFFTRAMEFTGFHIGCMTLPQIIKHEAHPHKLKHVIVDEPISCKACGDIYYDGDTTHGCEQCHNYKICGSCIIKARVVNHPWDPHPLHLIYDPGLVIDHEHDFSCEFCGEDIDTNFWFYHCNDCDLSFHLNTCFERSRYREYSHVKFGATDIVIGKLHPHSLTFVLNKKVRNCENCHKKQLGEPVLECAGPCRSIIFCTHCVKQYK